METAIYKIEDIHPAPYNPRVTLQPGDKEWEDLNRSLSRFGLVIPLIVNTTTGFLVGGHQRLNALKAQGATEAEVVLIQKDSEAEKLLNIFLNKAEGETDYKKLKELFEDIKPEDVEFTGYSVEEVNALFDTEDDDEDAMEDYDAGPEDEEDTEDDDEEPENKAEPFDIYLSFPSKEAAESWLERHGVEAKYEGTSRNITVRMEGIEYGTGNQN